MDLGKWGHKFKETVTRVCRADQGAWTESAASGIDAKITEGRRQVVSPSGSCFSEVDTRVSAVDVRLWGYGGWWECHGPPTEVGGIFDR